MQKLIFLLTVLLSTTFIQSQDVVTKTVGDFNELKIFNKIQVSLVESDENKVEISGIKRRNINIIQKNQLLKISMSLDNIWDNNNTKVTVYYKELSKIDVNEGSRVVSDDVIRSNRLDLRAQEGASIKIPVEVSFIYAKAITGGEIELRGEAEEQEVIINSGGQYYAKELVTQNTQVKVSAGGTAEVQAKNYMKANTNAGGTIKVFGNPRELDTQKLLGGKIIEVN